MARTLVVGNPVVSLGADMLIADGALIVDGRTVESIGPRSSLAERGPFDRVIGSPDHVVMRVLSTATSIPAAPHSPGMAQYIFERANIHIHARGPITDEDLYHATLLSLIRCIRGGQTAIIDFHYGRPGLEHFGWPAVLQAYRPSAFAPPWG